MGDERITLILTCWGGPLCGQEIMLPHGDNALLPDGYQSGEMIYRFVVDERDGPRMEWMPMSKAEQL